MDLLLCQNAAHLGLIILDHVAVYIKGHAIDCTSELERGIIERVDWSAWFGTEGLSSSLVWTPLDPGQVTEIANSTTMLPNLSRAIILDLLLLSRLIIRGFPIGVAPFDIQIW